MQRAVLISMAALFLAWCAMAQAALPWITSSDFATVHVVSDPNAARYDQEAAAAFQRYWLKATGKEPTISERPLPERVNVYVGRSVLPKDTEKKLRLDQLETDGVIIRTVTARRHETPGLVLVGEGDRGTLYSVYEFFERYMGVRWLAPGVTHIPAEAPTSLPAIDYRYAPPFSWRENDYYRGYMQLPEGIELRRARKFPDQLQFICYEGHNLYKYVPPETWFSTHPEYYAEVNGVRINPVGTHWRDITTMAPEEFSRVGQLCLSNPEVAEIIAEGVRKVLQAHPEYPMVNVSQMDWGNNCECAQCRAIDEYEESPAGSLLTCINRIADLIAPDYPNVKIQTFAYIHTQKPPKHLKPRDNVVVVFAPIGLDYSRPMNDKSVAVNWQAYNDMKGWAKITKVMQGWEYTPNFANPNGPHPNLHTIQPNIQQYARCHVRDLFTQGWASAVPSSSEFQWLRTYIVDKALWNPEEDGEAHMREFVRLYYGQAAPYLLDYITLMTDYVKRPEVFMGCFDNQNWLNYDLVTQAQALFAKALDAAESPEIHLRVEEDYVPVQCAALACPPAVRQDGKTLSLVRPPSITLEEYLGLLKRFAAQGRPYEGYDPIKYITERCNGVTPPRQESSPIETLENEHARVWVTPNLHGAIVRWTDKATGTELFTGYREDSGFLGTFQDWAIASEQGSSENPVANTYEVIDRGADHITLRTTLDSGLTLEKTLSLSPDSNMLAVALRIRNTTGTPVAPHFKLHPEFSTNGATAPEVWRGDGTAWSRINAEKGEPKQVDGGLIAPISFNRWALRLPKARVTIVNTFGPEDLQGVFWFYNVSPDKQHANLELLPLDTPLQPGETRTLHTQYQVVRTPPEELKGDSEET